MSKIKRVLLVISILLISLLSMFSLTACFDEYDTDDDGLTNDFEEEIGTDPDEYTFNEETDEAIDSL